jgi:hypothetical protein
MSSYPFEEPVSHVPQGRLPRVDEIPSAPYGLDPVRVAEAFDAFNRELAWHRSQSAPPLPVPVGASGQELRQDALRLIRAAVEFADVVERDAQEVATRQITQAESVFRSREGELEAREQSVASQKAELERKKTDLLLAARREAEDVVANARHDAAEIRREADAIREHILEASRHQAIELTAAARAEVQRTLEWARAQAESVVRRARAVAEQLLAASLQGENTADVVRAIVAAAQAQADGARVARPAELPAGGNDPERSETAPASSGAAQSPAYVPSLLTQ